MAKAQESSLVRVRTELNKLPADVQEAVRGILTEDTANDAWHIVQYFETVALQVAEVVLKYAEAAVRGRVNAAQKDTIDREDAEDEESFDKAFPAEPK